METFAKIKQHYVQASLQKQETKLTEFKNQVFNKFYQVYQTERLSRFQDKKLSQNNEMILNRMVTFSWAEQLDKIWNKEQQKYMKTRHTSSWYPQTMPEHFFQAEAPVYIRLPPAKLPPMVFYTFYEQSRRPAGLLWLCP